jgi:hypothetical protein
MSPQQEEKINKCLEKLDNIKTAQTEMQTTLFGVKNQGGLMREVSEIKNDINDLKQLKWKAIGGITALSLLIGVVIKLTK